MTRQTATSQLMHYSSKASATAADFKSTFVAWYALLVLGSRPGSIAGFSIMETMPSYYSTQCNVRPRPHTCALGVIPCPLPWRIPFVRQWSLRHVYKGSPDSCQFGPRKTSRVMAVYYKRG